MGRRLALILFLVLTIFAVDPALFRDAVARRSLSDAPDLAWPGFADFIRGVRERTPPGASIAILVPALKWDEGYAYAFYRASYLLAGREVLPVVTQDGRPLRDNVARADYVAMWGGHLEMRRPVVWRGHGGELLGR